METFLIGLVVRGRACVVHGGDREALDKTRRLSDAGAHVTLIAPEVLPELAALVAARGIVWHARALQDADLEPTPFLVVSTPRDPDLSQRLYARALRERFLLSCIDQPAESTYFHPAVGTLGPVQLGFSSGGHAPGLLRRLRDDIVQGLGTEFAEYGRYLADVRAASVGDARRPAIQAALEGFGVEVKLHLPAGWRTRWACLSATRAAGA